MADDTTTEPTADDTTPDQEPVDDAQQAPATGASGADGDDKLGTPGKTALAEERKARRDAERAKREADRAVRDLQKQIQEYQDRDKSETEKAVARAESAEKRIDGLIQRAVRAEVRSLAIGQFEDADDAITHLREKFSGYTDDDGEIDASQIKADLADLLERKPHLAKKPPAEPEKRRQPAPDRTQASSANASRSSTPEDIFASWIKTQTQRK